LENEDFRIIINAIESGKCLAFLGAGACTSFKNHLKTDIPGLPTGGKLGEALAKKCQYSNGKDYNLLKVAEYFLYSHGGDREPLEKAIRDEIQIPCTPRPIHTVLAQLEQLKIVITTNYDTIMENELNKYRQLTWHYYNRCDNRTGIFNHSPEIEENEVVLYKMHGTVDKPESMVITESDYISYLTHLYDMERGMPDFFRKTWIPYCNLIFLGYSLNDWNFRVIWEGVLSDYRRYNPHKKAFALVKDATSFQKEHWRDRNIRVFEHDLTDFAVRLARHFNLEIPQMDIPKQVDGGAS